MSLISLLVVEITESVLLTYLMAEIRCEGSLAELVIFIIPAAFHITEHDVRLKHLTFYLGIKKECFSVDGRTSRDVYLSKTE